MLVRNFDMNPEAPEMDDTEVGLVYLLGEAEIAIGKAERAIREGDYQAAIDHMRSAGATLGEADWSNDED